MDLLGAQLLDAAAECLRILWTLESQKVGTETSNVRAGHGSTRNGVGVRVAVDPGRGDVRARGENVNEETEVGVRSAAILVIGSTDSADLWSRSWRGSDGWETRVTSGDSEEETLGDGLSDSGVGGWAERTTQRQVADGLADAALGLGVIDGPVDTCENTGVGSRSLSSENLHGDKSSLLGDTVGG